MVKIYREYISSEIVDIRNITQHTSYSHFHVPVPQKLAERSLVLSEKRLAGRKFKYTHRKVIFFDK